MPRQTFTVDGLTEAHAALAALPEAFREVAAATIERGSEMIEQEALTRVPVDKGDLRASIGRNVRSDGLQASVGSSDPKARWVEFATEDTPAQPFLWPAFQRGAKHVRKQMRGWAAEAGRKLKFRTKRPKRPKKVG